MDPAAAAAAAAAMGVTADMASLSLAAAAAAAAAYVPTMGASVGAGMGAGGGAMAMPPPPPMSDYAEIQTIYESPGFELPLTTACFDPCQELFWTGNNDGRVTSYYGMNLDKYTSFKVQNGVDIRSMYANFSNEIFVITPDCLACYSKLGYNIFKHSEVSFSNLQCLFYHQQQQRFLLGGYGNFLLDFDIERLRILRQITISDEQTDCILIKSTSSLVGGNAAGPSGRAGVLCTGSSNGLVILRDSSTLKCIHKFHPHSGSLSDFDVNGNLLVSCGFAMTRSGLQVDRFLMCYDLRMMRSLSPLQLLIEPCYLHFLPICSSVVAVASQANMSPFTGIANTFSMSTNCQSFAFGHSTGSIHLFTKGENTLFNDFSEPTVFADPPQYNQNYIDINDELASLSSVPVPIAFEKLTSDWHTDTDSKYRPTPPIKPELTENARVINNIMSVPNRLGLKRNQIYEEFYRKQLFEFDEASAKTSYDLNTLIDELNKANKPSAPVTSTQQQVSTLSTVSESTLTTSCDDDDDGTKAKRAIEVVDETTKPTDEEPKKDPPTESEEKESETNEPPKPSEERYDKNKNNEDNNLESKTS